MSAVRERLRRRLGTRDLGAEPIEMAIMAPVAILFCGLVVVGAMVGMTHLAVDHAAQAAARTASIARTPAEAQSYAQGAATETLSNSPGVNCVSQNVAVDTAGFSMPVGMPSTVTARVTCTVSIDVLDWMGMSGMRTVHKEASSPIDRLRERGR